MLAQVPAVAAEVASTSESAGENETESMTGRLHVETGSPDAFCPDLAQTRAAVARRLGRVEGAGEGWVARYTVAHSPRGTPRDFVRLELFAPDGARELSKDLPIEGSCSTLADVIALVLDRHFRGMSPAEPAPQRATVGRDLWRSLAPGDVSERKPTQPVLAARSDAAALPAAPAADRSGSGDSGQERIIGIDASSRRLAFAGFELGTEWTLGPSVALRALAEWKPQLFFGVALALGLARAREAVAEVEGAEVMSRSLTLDAHAGWGPRLGPVWLYAGPGARVTLDTGSGRGLPQSDVGERAVFGAGVHAGAAWHVAPRFIVNLSAVFDRSLSSLSGRFEVDGREVLSPSRYRAAVGLGLGFALSP